MQWTSKIKLTKKWKVIHYPLTLMHRESQVISGASQHNSVALLSLTEVDGDLFEQV